MLTLSQFVSLYPGSSIPSEVVCTDGTRLVLKMKGAGNGLHSLLAEFIVNQAAHRLGWPVPAAVPVVIPDGHPWTIGTDEFDDILQKSFGVNLGLQHLGVCKQLDRSQMLALPKDMLVQMATLDAFFLNYDRLPGSQNVLRDAKKKAWLIDHGSCQFLDADFVGKGLVLPRGHVLGEGQNPWIDKGLVPGLAAAARRAVEEVPGAWLEELGLTKDMLLRHVATRAQAA